MPTYEYRCGKCRHQFEEFQAMSAPPLRRCPKCGEAALERLISGGMGILVAGSTAEPPASIPAAPCGPRCGCHAPAGAGAGGEASATGAAGAAASGAAPGSAAGAGSGAAASNGASSSGANADPERATWKSKATHHSREGRGIGNLRSILTGKRPAGRAPAAAKRSTPRRRGK